MRNSIRLGINIDHVATIRQARRVDYPDPFLAAQEAIRGGADQITCHLREDRRHIRERDLPLLRSLPVPLNLEMAATDEMVAIASTLQPSAVTLVPERREELTTEGGLDCSKNFSILAGIVPRLRQAEIRVSLFIDPEREQIDSAQKLEVQAIEMHTGTYCAVCQDDQRRSLALERIRQASHYAHECGLRVHAGHGITLESIVFLLDIPLIEEYNIGHSIVARSLFVGLKQAVHEYRQLCDRAWQP